MGGLGGEGTPLRTHEPLVMAERAQDRRRARGRHVQRSEQDPRGGGVVWRHSTAQSLGEREDGVLGNGCEVGRGGGRRRGRGHVYGQPRRQAVQTSAGELGLLGRGGVR